MKQTHKSHHPSAKKDYAKRQQKQEMHTMCMEAVESAMDRHFAKMGDKKKKKRKRARESAETYNFEELSLDDNDDDKEKSSGEESFASESDDSDE